MAVTRLCSVPDCGKRHKARGYCLAHHHRFMRYGDPLGGSGYRQRNPPTCSVPGCARKPIARGWCGMHYDRWRHNGDPQKTVITPHGDRMRWIEAHVGFTGDECLPWPFPSTVGDTDRPACVPFRERHMTACRVMCILAHGEPPTDSHESAHSCGKGDEGCINPKHLSWKTPAENMADKVIHGTQPRGEESHLAVLTTSEVRRIRSMTGTSKEVAPLFGVSPRHIRNIRSGGSWAWLD